MSDFPGQAQPPPFLHTYSKYSMMPEYKGVTGASVTAASTTWSTANQARYYPISIPFWYPVRRVFWVNGSTTTSTNNDFGIYTADTSPRNIYSTGSTAQSGASVPQFVTPGTTFWLPPGDYYFGMNISSASTNRCFGTAATADNQRFAGILQEAVGAVTLPDPATPVAATIVGTNLCGVTWTASGY